jgi:hypothetical protein|tara:strand:- start:2519 stop:2725 length:207 start_codon:yes stop_codon:yes gene_type:complete
VVDPDRDATRANPASSRARRANDPIVAPLEVIGFFRKCTETSAAAKKSLLFRRRHDVSLAKAQQASVS